MAGVPLLQINDHKIINWWNITEVNISHEGDGSSRPPGCATIYYIDADSGMSTDLTKEETRAFLLFVKDNGDRLNVRDSSPQDTELYDAGDRFADLAAED
jgi:hypothetical protein